MLLAMFLALHLLFIYEIRGDVSSDLQQLLKDVNSLKSQQEHDTQQLQTISSRVAKNNLILDGLVVDINVSGHRQTNITHGLDLYKSLLSNATQTQTQQNTETESLKKKEQAIESDMSIIKAQTARISNGRKLLRSSLTDMSHSLSINRDADTKQRADDVKLGSSIKSYEKSVQAEYNNVEPTVAFMARLQTDQGHVQPEITGLVKLTDLPLNVGSGYNVTSGVFTAPVKGIYMFKLEASADGKNLYLDLASDHIVYGTLVAQGAGGEKSGNADAVVRMNAGDKMWVEGAAGNGQDSAVFIQFSGAFMATF